jgi:hypothetical protein
MPERTDQEGQQLPVHTFVSHNTVWADKHDLYVRGGGVNIHNSHLWAWDNPHAIHEHEYQVYFTISAWTGIIRDTAVGPYLLTAQQYHD